MQISGINVAGFDESPSPGVTSPSSKRDRRRPSKLTIKAATLDTDDFKQLKIEDNDNPLPHPDDLHIDNPENMEDDKDSLSASEKSFKLKVAKQYNSEALRKKSND